MVIGLGCGMKETPTSNSNKSRNEPINVRMISGSLSKNGAGKMRGAGLTYRDEEIDRSDTDFRKVVLLQSNNVIITELSCKLGVNKIRYGINLISRSYGASHIGSYGEMGDSVILNRNERKLVWNTYTGYYVFIPGAFSHVTIVGVA